MTSVTRRMFYFSLHAMRTVMPASTIIVFIYSYIPRDNVSGICSVSLATFHGTSMRATATRAIVPNLGMLNGHTYFGILPGRQWGWSAMNSCRRTLWNSHGPSWCSLLQPVLSLSLSLRLCFSRRNSTGTRRIPKQLDVSRRWLVDFPVDLETSGVRHDGSCQCGSLLHEFARRLTFQVIVNNLRRCN